MGAKKLWGNANTNGVEDGCEEAEKRMEMVSLMVR